MPVRRISPDRCKAASFRPDTEPVPGLVSPLQDCPHGEPHPPLRSQPSGKSLQLQT
jgi:hypothetical protein